MTETTWEQYFTETSEQDTTVSESEWAEVWVGTGDMPSSTTEVKVEADDETKDSNSTVVEDFLQGKVYKPGPVSWKPKPWLKDSNSTVVEADDETSDGLKPADERAMELTEEYLRCRSGGPVWTVKRGRRASRRKHICAGTCTVPYTTDLDYCTDDPEYIYALGDEAFDREDAWWSHRPEREVGPFEPWEEVGNSCRSEANQMNFLDLLADRELGVLYWAARHSPARTFDTDAMRAWKLHPYQAPHPVQMLTNHLLWSALLHPELHPSWGALSEEDRIWVRDLGRRTITEPYQAAAKQYAKVLANYLFMACWGEARHHSMVGGVIIAPPAERNEARVEGRILTNEWGSDKAAHFLKTVFDARKWSPSYGGKPWALIAEVLWEYIKGNLPDVVFVDHVMNLEHNGGICLSKYLWPTPYTEDSNTTLTRIRREFGPLHGHRHPDYVWAKTWADEEVVEAVEYLDTRICLLSGGRNGRSMFASPISWTEESSTARYGGETIVRLESGGRPAIHKIVDGATKMRDFLDSLVKESESTLKALMSGCPEILDAHHGGFSLPPSVQMKAGIGLFGTPDQWLSVPGTRWKRHPSATEGHLDWNVHGDGVFLFATYGELGFRDCMILSNAHEAGADISYTGFAKSVIKLDFRPEPSPGAGEVPLVPLEEAYPNHSKPAFSIDLQGTFAKTLKETS